MVLTADQSSDVAFIWRLNFPNWPYLPMKRHRDNGLEGGILVDRIPLGTSDKNKDPNHESLRTMYFAYWWDLATGKLKDLKDVEKKIYPSVEAMVADGWQVD